MLKNRNAYMRNYYRNNRERLREYKRVWNKANRACGLTATETKWHRNYLEKYPERKSAHSKVHEAVKSGKLKKSPCKCGDKNVVAHHDNYLYPLKVKWICRVCHRKLHYGDTKKLKGLYLKEKKRREAKRKKRRQYMMRKIKELRPKTLKEIARIIGVSYTTVSWYARLAGIDTTRPEWKKISLKCLKCEKVFRGYKNRLYCSIKCFHIKRRKKAKARKRKMCYHCYKVKPIKSFPSNKCRIDGKGSLCNPCNTRAVGKWMRKNAERHNRYQRYYYAWKVRKNNKKMLVR